ncbi:uncharacterized protein LOC130827484 [Amaranthus tricolor]|uniref:uncharacterized protein LOC130827484 n=1 Tax=Amaranthus tricolor TaxID=29722 RepID=UPI00258B1C5B|nr:uncharacterized protein LOC130827484 [Amaranthus tricolor]
MSQGVNARGRPLPKFGEWEANNPSSDQGFTMIFNKARDQKKTNGTVVGSVGLGVPLNINQNHDYLVNNHHNHDQNPKQEHKQPHHEQRGSRKWLGCFYPTGS